MTNTEQKIGQTIAELIPKLTEEEKEKFLCFAAMADALAKPRAG